MPVCTNSHHQPDFAKFCGICGSPVLANVVADQDVFDSQQTTSEAVTSIDLDLMLDDADADGSTDLVLDDDDSTDDDTADDDTADDDTADDDSTGLTLDSFDDAGDSSQTQVASAIFGTTVKASAMQLLNDWAVEIDELDDPYIEGLTNAVARRDDLSVWASLDPLELLPTRKFKSLDRLTKIASLVSSLRNILVFLPVFITWLAIGKAIDAFGNFKLYAAENLGKSSSFSFIEFWRNPDEFAETWLKNVPEKNSLLDSFWWITDVARLDGYIIFAIIFLTTISATISWLGDNRGVVEQEKADRKRLEVGLAIASSLHGKRQATPDSISEALAEALNDLTQAARDVNETASRLEKASLGVESLTPRIEILNTHTEQLVAQTATSVSKAVSDLVKSVENLNTSVGGNVTALFSEAANTLEEVSKQLARTSNSAEYGIKQLRDDLDAIHKQLQTLTKGGRP